MNKYGDARRVLPGKTMDEQDGNPGKDRFSGRNPEPACPAVGCGAYCRAREAVRADHRLPRCGQPRRRRIIATAASMRWPFISRCPTAARSISTARPRRTSVSPTRPSPSTMPSSGRAVGCRTRSAACVATSRRTGSRWRPLPARSRRRLRLPRDGRWPRDLFSSQQRARRRLRETRCRCARRLRRRAGREGPQASTVRIAGKHGLR